MVKTRRHYFINLTNGIEKLSELRGERVSFMRIRSTTVERKDYLFLFNDLNHNFLISLVTGDDCFFVDYGTNRKNSKTCYFAIPLIRYVLSRRWGLNYDRPYRLGRGSDDKIYDVEPYFEHIYNELFVWNQNNEKKKLKAKIDYYKRFLFVEELKLQSLCEATENDGNYNYYSKLLKEFKGVSC